MGVLAMCCLQTYAQTRSTKESKVVLVFDENTVKVSGVELFTNFQKMKMETALRKYPNSKFFIGLLQGNYHLDEGTVIPGEGATITVYTQKQFWWNEQISWSEGYNIGDGITIGQKNAKVLSSKKGELILRTQQ